VHILHSAGERDASELEEIGFDVVAIVMGHVTRGAQKRLDPTVGTGGRLFKGRFHIRPHEKIVEINQANAGGRVRPIM
jgi:hypothetical protein